MCGFVNYAHNPDGCAASPPPRFDSERVELRADPLDGVSAMELDRDDPGIRREGVS